MISLYQILKKCGYAHPCHKKDQDDFHKLMRALGMDPDEIPTVTKADPQKDFDEMMRQLGVQQKKRPAIRDAGLVSMLNTKLNEIAWTMFDDIGIHNVTWVSAPTPNVTDIHWGACSAHVSQFVGSNNELVGVMSVVQDASGHFLGTGLGSEVYTPAGLLTNTTGTYPLTITVPRGGDLMEDVKIQYGHHSWNLSSDQCYGLPGQLTLQANSHRAFECQFECQPVVTPALASLSDMTGWASLP